MSSGGPYPTANVTLTVVEYVAALFATEDACSKVFGAGCVISGLGHVAITALVITPIVGVGCAREIAVTVGRCEVMVGVATWATIVGVWPPTGGVMSGAPEAPCAHDASSRTTSASAVPPNTTVDFALVGASECRRRWSPSYGRTGVASCTPRPCVPRQCARPCTNVYAISGKPSPMAPNPSNRALRLPRGPIAPHLTKCTDFR